MRPVYLFAYAIACALCASWRISQFGDIDLVSDQAFFTQWIKRLVFASHFFPVDTANMGFVISLMKDQESFLSIFLGQIYQAHAVLFTVVSVAIYFLASVIWGASLETIVGGSIIFSVVGLWLIAAFPLLIQQSPRVHVRNAALIGAITLFLGLISSFFNVFSAMGPHNVGVMLMVLSMITTQVWLCGLDDRKQRSAGVWMTTIMFVIQWTAIYAHYTNVFILPPATAIAIMTLRGHEMKARAKLLYFYSGFTMAAFIPAVTLVFLYDSSVGGGVNTQTFSGLTLNVVLYPITGTDASFTERVPLWFSNISTFYSTVGLTIGVLGVFGLAWRQRLTFPASIVITHFMAGILLQVFTQYDRTAAYILPVLMLGGGWFLATSSAWIVHNARYGSASRLPVIATTCIIVSVAVSHLSVELPRLKSPEKIHPWGRLATPPIWKKAISNIDAIVPPGSSLMAWDYATTHQFRATTNRRLGTLLVTRPLETMVARKRAGSLSRYIEKRGLKLPRNRPLFVLAPINISKMELENSLSDVLGDDGFGNKPPAGLVEQRQWKFSDGKYHSDGLVLYRTRW